MTGDRNRVDRDVRVSKQTTAKAPPAAVGGEPRTIRDKSTIVRHRSQYRQVRLFGCVPWGGGGGSRIHCHGASGQPAEWASRRLK